MIVADTGAVLALIDADDRHHQTLAKLFSRDPKAWMLPWAILPEVDYLLATRLGAFAQDAFLEDVASGAFSVAWGEAQDLKRAHQLCREYSSLRLGLVDATVMAIAERLQASAIATTDLRDFGGVNFRRSVKLIPRDL